MCQCFAFTYRKWERETGDCMKCLFRVQCYPYISIRWSFLFEYCGVLRVNICINKSKIQHEIRDSKRFTATERFARQKWTRRHFQTIQPYNIFRIFCISMWKRAYTRKFSGKIFSGNQEHNSMEWIEIMFVLINERHQQQLDAVLWRSFHALPQMME